MGQCRRSISRREIGDQGRFKALQPLYAAAEKSDTQVVSLVGGAIGAGCPALARPAQKAVVSPRPQKLPGRL